MVQLPVGALYRGGLTVIPEKDCRITSLSVRRGDGDAPSSRRHSGVFDIPRCRAHRRRQSSPTENLDLPAGSTSRRMDNLLARSVCQPRGTPTLIEPQAPYELFRNSAVPGTWRFGNPGTRWYRRVEGVPGHGCVGHGAPNLG